MPFPAGAKLGPYEIVGLLGAGGMGEVYRAKDPRLGRDVAIKTLPSGLAGDSDRLRRFETEARAASLLSHPDILAVFDVGTADGQPYIVSELLEGENLARAAQSRSAAVVEERRDRGVDRRRPRRRACARHRPSRPQAGERVPDA